MTQVNAPNGDVVNFPDSMSDAQIEAVMRREYPPPAPPAPPSRAEQQAVLQSRIGRMVEDSTMPGMGAITGPLIRLATDPRRRAELGRNIQGGVNLLRQAPSLNLPQLVGDTIAQGRQAWNSFTPDSAGRIVQALPGALWNMTGAPFQNEQNASDAEAAASARGDPAAAQQAAGQAVNATGGIAVNTAGALSAPLVGTNAARAALAGAALTLPQALAGRSGPLQMRLPGALTDTTGAAAIGAGLSRLGGATAPSPSTVNDVSAFERANVPPIFAAARGQESAPLTMAIAENPLGGNVRRNLQASANATRDEAQRLAGQYGAPLARESAGEAIQGGVNRWAAQAQPGPTDLPGAYATPSRLWSFDSKASALYDHVLGRISGQEDAMLSGGARGASGAPMVGDMPPLTVTTNTQAALNAVLGRVRNPALQAEVTDPQLARWANLFSDPGQVHFGDLRAFRTYVRNLQRAPMLRQGVDDAGLQRLEGALTQDIAQSASNIGGPQAAHVLARVDKFYRVGNQRIQTALAPFADARNPGQAYDRIIQLASDRTGANTPALLSLKRTLRPDEFRSVQATVIDRMGRVNSGAVNALEEEAFSLDNFVTNYAKLSPQGRSVLFGSRGGGASDDLASALDNLAYVAGRQKAVKGFTNYSRSGSSLQNIGTIGAGFGAAARMAVGDFMPALEFAGAGLGMRVMGEALTNPRFVRWAVGAAKAGGGWRRTLPQLASFAARDPALLPAYNALAHAQAASPGAQTATAPALQ